MKKLELIPEIREQHYMHSRCEAMTQNGQCNNKAHYIIGGKKLCTWHFDNNIVRNGNCYLQGKETVIF